MFTPMRMTPLLASTTAVLTLAAVASVALIGQPASAQAYGAATQRACKGDYKRLCPRYEINSSELRYCMESQARSISRQCIRAAVDNGELSRSRARSIGHNF
jgi:hypothetical protein